MSVTMRYVITGFMGAGKSTVARALARRLGCEAVDLDLLITKREGSTPQRLIEEEGEACFRAKETEALRDALADTLAGGVIATGGGAWTIEENRALLGAHGCLVVWLDAPFELCWRRITADTQETRPLARDRGKALELYRARRSIYSLGTLRVEVLEESSAEEIAAEIINMIASPARAEARRLKEDEG